jgi:putative DNA primase/helicase
MTEADQKLPRHLGEAAVAYRESRARRESAITNGGDTAAQAPQFSDEDLALRFAGRHKDDLRYCAAWSRWFTWKETHWETDETLSTFSLSRALCRSVAAMANKKSLRAQLASAKTSAAVERLARADRRFAATVEQWDADTWLLNTLGGAVDLHTGTMRRHSQLDYCTKMTAVAPNTTKPRLWLEFLKRITDGNPELQGFLQRVAGYALTGDIREHALFFGYGTGANGKSVFVNTLSGMLGTYHRTASIETFVAATTDRHPTELAWLRGARRARRRR